jgi:hypothetical protein
MARTLIERLLHGFRKTAPLTFELPEQSLGSVVEVWLEQADALHQLEMHRHAQRKLELAEYYAQESIRKNPASLHAWLALGRVQLAASMGLEAQKTFETARQIAQQQRDLESVQHALTQLAIATELVASKQQSFDDGAVIERMFHACKSCGHLILFIGGHCCHCHSAPETADDVAISSCLSTLYFQVPTMLDVCKGIQQQRPLFELIPGFSDVVARHGHEGAEAVLSKIQANQADDLLDYTSLIRCEQCAIELGNSWLKTCANCEAPVTWPALLRLLICIEHLLQHFTWGVRRSETEEFADFVTLLVTLKGTIMRRQKTPTAYQQRWALNLLPTLSPLYMDNGAGLVRIDGAHRVGYQVLNEDQRGIMQTLEHLTAEFRHFAHLMNSQVTLF